MQQKCVIFLLKNRKTITEKPFFLIFSPVSLIIIIIQDRQLCCIEGELMIGELLRKSIHLSGLTLPVIYIFLDKSTMLVLIGILAGLALAVELVKWLFPPFGDFFFRIFKPLLRRHERKGAITGATYYLISAFLCIFFFAKTLAIVCIFFHDIGRYGSCVGG